MRRHGFAVVGIVAFTALAASIAVHANDQFPILGTYTENTPCPGADSGVVRVKITEHDIDSPILGRCAILERKRESERVFMHVECKGPGGASMLGDINFTIKGDNTLDFADQDSTYKAVLYKCSP